MPKYYNANCIKEIAYNVITVKVFPKHKVFQMKQSFAEVSSA